MWFVKLLTMVKRLFEYMSCRIAFTVKMITVVDQHVMLQIWDTASQVMYSQRDQLLADEYGMEFFNTHATDKASVTESRSEPCSYQTSPHLIDRQPNPTN
eukprot:410389_1